MWKKIVALTLAVSMLGMTACGSSSSSSGDTTAAETKAEAASEESKAEGETEAADADYKIGLMISPLATREEYYRTAEMLIQEYGSEKFVMDVYPENPQNEQEVTISKALNMAMDPDVKVMIFDSADIGTIAAVDKIKEERPEMKIYFGSLNEDIYEQQKVADLMITIFLYPARGYHFLTGFPLLSLSYFLPSRITFQDAFLSTVSNWPPSALASSA